MAHREGIRSYLKDVQVSGQVIDWGCGTKPIMNYLNNIDNVVFCNIDQKEYPKVTQILNLEKYQSLPPADFAFCIEVIEHIWNTRVLLDSIWNGLKKGGVLYLSQPFLYEVHKDDDRIRYTHHGLRKILEATGFTVEDIQPTVGDLDHAEGYIVKAIKK